MEHPFKRFRSYFKNNGKHSSQLKLFIYKHFWEYVELNGKRKIQKSFKLFSRKVKMFFVIAFFRNLGSLKITKKYLEIRPHPIIDRLCFLYAKKFIFWGSLALNFNSFDNGTINKQIIVFYCNFYDCNAQNILKLNSRMEYLILILS